MATIAFKKFKPSSDLAKHAETILLQLADFVPTGAEISACILKLKEKYHCSIQVNSAGTSFVQDSLAEDPVFAINEVNEKLKTDILDWKIEHLHTEEESFWNFTEVKT